LRKGDKIGRGFLNRIKGRLAQVRRFLPLLRILLSAVLIALIFYYLVDSRQFVKLLRSAKLSFLLLCVAIIVADRFVMAWKWIILLRTQGSIVSFRAITELTFISTFFGLFLPSILGGDLVRAYGLAKNISNANLSISSVLIDRTIGVSSMMAISLVSAFGSYSYIANSRILMVVFIFAGIFGVLVLLVFSSSGPKLLDKLLPFKGWDALRKKLKSIYDSFLQFKAYKTVLLYAIALSFASQIMRIAVVYFSSLSLNLSTDFIYFLIFVPLTIILSILPVSIAGIGIREGAFIYFFTQVGMTSSSAFTLALLVYFLPIIGTLPGAFIYAFRGLSGKKGV